MPKPDAPPATVEPEATAVDAEQQELVPRSAPTGVRVHQDTGREARIYDIEFTDGVNTWRSPLWSVTTLLRVLDKPALVQWAAGATAAAAFEQREYLEADVRRHGVEEAIYRLSQARFTSQSNAADIGTAVHGLIEAHVLQSTPPNVDPALQGEVQPRFEQFLRWVEDFKPEFRQAEATVYHPEDGWAGTLDLIAEVGDLGNVLIDVKNTRAGREGNPGVYPENGLQVAAYANAKWIAGTRGVWVEPFPMFPIGAGAVLWLHPTRYAFIPVDISEKAYRAFRVAAELYRYMDIPAKRAIGKPLTPAMVGILPTVAEQEASPFGRPTDALINEKQRKRMLAIGSGAGLDHAGVKRVVLEVTGATSTTLVPLARYDEVCARIEGAPWPPADPIDADPGPEAEAA
ncbi:MAG: hypothetical protein AB7O78_01590 [Thermoleophilia bacterium]